MTLTGVPGFRVAVMAKYPTPGQVKTRLGRHLGPAFAAALQRAFVLDLDERLRGVGIDAMWAYWPADAPFGALLPNATVLTQEGADLGERMAGTAERVFSMHGVPVVLLGTDIPHLDVALVQRAGQILAAGTDVVLGPADDGGYYLLGLRRYVPALFEGIPWGSAAVCAETRTRCATLGLTVTLLPGDFDVDEPADLLRLAGVLAQGRVVLPRTAALLARTVLS